MSAGKGNLWGIVAEFATPEELIEAAARVREAGYRKWDCHTPFPVHGLDGAMGIRPTNLPWFVLAAGLTGCLGGVLMQWWMNAVDYPILISGKPLWSLPANIPVAFELTILLAALTAFGLMMVFNRLPQWSHPLFRSEKFRRATNDRFFLSIEAADPRFVLAATRKFLEGLAHVSAVHEVEH